MDIEFVEHHHLFILRIVERLLVCLAIRGNVRAKRRVTGLRELNPHFAHDLREGFIKDPARTVVFLGMFEQRRKLGRVSALHIRQGGFGREVIGVRLAAALCLCLRQPDVRRVEPELAKQPAVFFIFFSFCIINMGISVLKHSIR